MATEELFPPIRRTSAVSQASGRIREMILSGRLRPGDRLPPERELSEALRISRPTVRESIRSLVAMNILESRHGRGTFVASLDTRKLLEPLSFVLALASRDLDDLFEARLLLEPRLAALAAERATTEDVQALRVCAAAGAARRRDPDAMVELGARLHRLLAKACHNDLLVTLLDSVAALGAEGRALAARLPTAADDAVGDHAELVEAVAARDPGRAEAAMTAHLGRLVEAAHRAAAGGGRPGEPARD
jgi:DNA-binding FadR family transcriptional regulator